MKTVPHDHYTYRVTWSDEDKEYVGLCAEFPGLSWLPSAPEAALRGVRSVVADVVEDMNRQREPIPEPLASRPLLWGAGGGLEGGDQVLFLSGVEVGGSKSQEPENSAQESDSHWISFRQRENVGLGWT